MGQIFIRVFRFTPVSIIPQTPHIDSFIHARITNATQFYKLLNNILKEEKERLHACSSCLETSVLPHTMNWKTLASP